MKRVSFLFAIAFASLTAAAQMPNAPFGFGGNQNSDSQAQYSEKFADINYAGDDLASHTLDIYLPKEKKDKYPVIVHIYGSAWFSNSSKGIADINTICAALLEAGYAVVTPNHRASIEAKYPAQINDIKAVVRFLRGNADKYKLDASFIGTSGFSSGAHLASLMATSNGVKYGRCGKAEYDIEGTLGNYTEYSSMVNACCEWSGPIDLLNMDCDGIEKPKNSPEEVVMGMPKEGNEDYYKLLNTTYYIDANDVPVGMFHGDADNVVPCCQSDLLFEKLQQAGVKTFFIKQPGGGHGFNMYSPENLKKMVEWFDAARLGAKN
ncbi:MAG: alpha/beta hydrolase [Bacteroidales bacterium]|nr:alpha/beta hydrolase [Bacteroidales bacterium]